jgi:hypothetical protein
VPADVLRSSIGLLRLGKNDYETVTNRREDEFLHLAMNVGTVPSAETLRQRTSKPF